MRRPNSSNGVTLVSPADPADAAALFGDRLPDVDAHVLAPTLSSSTCLTCEAVDERAPQAVVDDDQRRHRHFAGRGLGRQRVFGDAADLA